MSEALSLQGKLEVLPELLRTIIVNQGLASLTIQRDDTESIFYFENGKIISAATNDSDFFLPEILFVKGEIDFESYLKIQELLRKRKSLVEALQESGALSPDDFIRVMEIQIQEILNLVCRWTSGNYILTFLEKFPEDLIPLRVNTERIILNAVRQIQRFSSVKKGLGSFHRPFLKVPELDSKIYKMELKDEENYILSFFEERKTITEALNLSYLSNFETLKIIWGLYVLHLIREETEEKREKIDERNRELIISGMVESYNNAYSTIYNGIYQIIGDEAEEILSEVFSKLSPEYKKAISGNLFGPYGRLDYDALMDYVYREKIKDQMQFLQDFLNEVLYAWVLHVRLKFGNKVENVLEKAISEVREG